MLIFVAIILKIKNSYNLERKLNIIDRIDLTWSGLTKKINHEVKIVKPTSEDETVADCTLLKN